MHVLLEKYLQAIKSCLPQKSLVPSVGLDIDLDSCKLIELVKKDGFFEILQWAVEPVENTDLEGAIRRLLSRLNVQSKAPYTALSGKGTLIRYIDMPRMPTEDLKKSFDIEADRYFPFSKDQIYTDCYILNTESQDKQVLVLVAAAKREIIQERMELLTRLGFSCPSISLNSIALGNVFQALRKMSQNSGRKGEPQPQAMAVLDVEETLSNLIVVVNDRPRFNRDIFIGGQDLTKKISNVLAMSLTEAKRLRIQPGNRLPEILAICYSVLMNLVSEVRFSFDYFTTEHNMPIGKLFLSGSCALFGGITEVFSKNLDMTLERWNPVQNFKLGPGVNAEEIYKNAGQLAVALGLALAEYD